MTYSESENNDAQYTNGRSIREIAERVFALRRAMKGTKGQLRINLASFWRSVGKRRIQDDR